MTTKLPLNEIDDLQNIFIPEIDIPICNSCKHYLKKYNCKAFPLINSIPNEILNGLLIHNSVLPNQVDEFIYTPNLKTL